jgi:hypothetical protein
MDLTDISKKSAKWCIDDVVVRNDAGFGDCSDQQMLVIDGSVDLRRF